MKAIVVVHSFHISGVLTQARICARHLVAQGYEVTVVGRPGLHGESLFAGDGARTFGCSDRWQLRRSPWIIDATLVICESLFADELAQAIIGEVPHALRALRVHEEVTDQQLADNLWQYKLSRSPRDIFGDFDLIIFPSHHTRSFYAAVCGGLGSRWAVVPNTVDERMPQANAVSTDTFRILQLGTVGARKNPLLTLEAFDHFRGEYNASDAELRFVGARGATEAERSYIRALEDAIATKGLGNNVDIVGTRLSPDADLSWASIVTLHSSSECSPTVLLEANFFGKKFVAPAIGGIPELVVDELNGFLFPFGDFRAQARLFGTLYVQRAALHASAAAVRAHYHENFSNALFTRNCDNVVRELLGA